MERLRRILEKLGLVRPRRLPAPPRPRFDSEPPSLAPSPIPAPVRACAPEFPTRWVALWAAEWVDGRITVVTEPTFEAALRRTRTLPLRDSRAGHDPTPRVFHRLEPVDSIRLRIRGRLHHCAPAEGYLRYADRDIRWRRPHGGVLPSVRPAVDASSDRLPERTALPRGLWSCVTPRNELVLFTAGSFDEAYRRAVKTVAPGADRSDVESVVEGIELWLAPEGQGHAPAGYRIQLHDRVFEWPPDSTEPPPVSVAMPVPRPRRFTNAYAKLARREAARERAREATTGSAPAS